MDSKIEKEKRLKIQNIEISETDSILSEEKSTKLGNNHLVDICDENLTTLKKIHAILLNCLNLSKQQKLEFCESERYFMKLYLQKLKNKNDL